MAIVRHALGDAGRAASLYRMLEPYSGRNLRVGTTIACSGIRPKEDDIQSLI